MCCLFLVYFGQQFPLLSFHWVPLVRRQFNSMDQETSTQDDGRGTLSRQVCAVSKPWFVSNVFCVREHDLPSLRPPFFKGYVSLGFSHMYIYILYIYLCIIYIVYTNFCLKHACIYLYTHLRQHLLLLSLARSAHRGGAATWASSVTQQEMRGLGM